MPGRNSSEAGPLHDQIARHIRTQIEAGVLRDREALPSTRDLAERWGVSVFTANEAMQTLTEEGIVVSKSRSGRIVNAPSERQDSPRSITTPQVVLVGGYAGSGKTEFGRILARAAGWPILDKDTATRPVVETALETLGRPRHDRDSPTYMDLIRPGEYEGLMAAADENAACGLSVIVTAPFLRELNDPAWLARTAAQFDRYGAQVRVVWLHCDPDSMRYYLRERGAARDAAKLGDWTTYLSGMDTDLRPVADHFAIDNSRSAEPLQAQAKILLSSLAENQ